MTPPVVRRRVGRWLMFRSERFMDVCDRRDWPAWTYETTVVFDWAQRGVCAVMGHDPSVDQCGLPEHDFCLWCGTLTPGAGACRGAGQV